MNSDLGTGRQKPVSRIDSGRGIVLCSLWIPRESVKMKMAFLTALALVSGALTMSEAKAATRHTYLYCVVNRTSVEDAGFGTRNYCLTSENNCSFDVAVTARDDLSRVRRSTGLIESGDEGKACFTNTFSIEYYTEY
jgi:hypothetical protein